MKKNPNLAFTILRFGLALVFIWFATHQLMAPEKWVVFLPDFVKVFPISAIAFVKINALFELLGSVLLILGMWTRVVALLLALHLLGIAFTFGLTATGMRDFGLAVGVIAIAIGGPGSYSIDEKNDSPSMPL